MISELKKGPAIFSLEGHISVTTGRSLQFKVAPCSVNGESEI